MTERQPRLALFQIITALLWFSIYAYVPNLSAYAEDMGASLSIIGLITGSYGFVQMALRIPLGILSDSIRRRRIFVTIGFGFSLAGALVLFLAPSPGLLVVGRGLAGAAAATWVVATVLYSSYFDPARSTRAMAVLNTFNNGGQVVAMLLGSWAVARFGPRAMFLVAAAGAALGLFLTFGATESLPNKPPMRPRDFFAVAKDRPLIIISVMALLLQVNTMSTISGFTPLLAKGMGAGSMELGVLSMITTAMAAVGCLSSGTTLVAKVGERRYLALSALGLALFTALMPLARSLPALYALQGIAGFSQGVLFSLLMGLAIRHIEVERRASAMGLFQAVYGIGMFLGPVLVGWLSDAFGLSWGILAVGVISLGILPLTVLLGRAWRRLGI